MLFKSSHRTTCRAQSGNISSAELGGKRYGADQENRQSCELRSWVKDFDRARKAARAADMDRRGRTANGPF